MGIVITEYFNPLNCLRQALRKTKKSSYHAFVRPTECLQCSCFRVKNQNKPVFQIFSALQILFPNNMNASIIEMYKNYLLMFVTNFVSQLQARSEIPLHCLEHIALPKVKVASLYAIRSRREYGDFQRPIERKRHPELAL